MTRLAHTLEFTTLASASTLPARLTGSMGFDHDVEDALKRGYVAAFRILGDRDAASEACQEAASRALTAQRRFDPSRPFYPWFYRILKNHCLDLLELRRREVPAQVEADGPLAPSNPTPTAEQGLVTSERQAAVLRGIARLEDDLREIIELRHFQDLSYEAMAEVLGCPIGTVMSRLYRARKRLRDLLLEDPDFAGSRGAR